jgi:SAM-dependent methyltransferase
VTAEDPALAEWQSIAPGWERWRAHLEEGYAPVRAWLVGALPAETSGTILELSAGAGDTGFEALAAAGPDARLISSDFAPEMVDVARRRGAALGFERVDYRVIDAQRIDLRDSSVDAVICRSGFMLMPDPAAAFAEVRRVLRPGGRLAFSVWGRAERNPWRTVGQAVLEELGLADPIPPDEPGTFTLSDAARTAALVEAAGFTVEESAEIATHFVFRDAAEWERWANDLGDAPRDLAEVDRRRLREALTRAFAPYATDSGLALPGVALGFAAR